MDISLFVVGIIIGVIISHVPYMSTLVGIFIGVMLHDNIVTKLRTIDLKECSHNIYTKCINVWKQSTTIE